MLNIFKYINYARKARQGYNKPEELIAETSFAPVEGIFILSFIALGIISGISLYVGFYYSYFFFKFIGIVFLLFLIGDIIIYSFVKRVVSSISSKLTNRVRGSIKRKNTIEVEAIDVE